MLGKADATPMIAVKDLDRARKFYEETLGLEAHEAMAGEVLEVTSGDTKVEVYRSEYRRHQQGDRADLQRRRHRVRGPRAQGQGRHVRTL